MLLNLNQVFLTLDGQKMQDVRQVEDGKDKDGKIKFKEEKQDLILHRIVILALIEPVHKLAEGDKVKFFELALKLNAAKAGTVELTAGEITTIQGAVKPKYGVIITGEAIRMLDGKDIGIDIKEEKIDPPEPVAPTTEDIAEGDVSKDTPPHNPNEVTIVNS